MKKKILNKAFEILLAQFKKAYILPFDELLYWLNKEVPIEDEDDLLTVRDWYQQLVNLHYLQELPSDFCNIFIGEKSYGENYKKEQFPIKLLVSSSLQLHFEILCHREKVTWNANKPYASFFHAHQGKKYRFTLIHSSISPRGESKLFIRKIQEEILPLKSFLQPKEETFFLSILHGRKNILISGATGSGKTSFLSSLLSQIPPHEHSLIFEDTKELQPPPNATELLASSQEGKTLVDFCHYALRMSPDRLIIGEMRGAEVVPYLLMMNTGHRGLISTIHANSAIDTLHRLAFLFTIYGGSEHLGYEDILKLVTQNIDYIAYLERGRVKECIKVLGSEKKHCFFEKVELANSNSNCPSSLLVN